jgi:hypothetical protein
VTDIEGDAGYFGFMKTQLKAVLNTDGSKMADGWCLVVGGDMVDKGKASIRVLQFFVTLEEKSRPVGVSPSFQPLLLIKPARAC